MEMDRILSQWIKQREGSIKPCQNRSMDLLRRKGEITYQVLYKNNMIFKVLKDKKPNNKTSPEINTKIR